MELNTPHRLAHLFNLLFSCSVFVMNLIFWLASDGIERTPSARFIMTMLTYYRSVLGYTSF